MSKLAGRGLDCYITVSASMEQFITCVIYTHILISTALPLAKKNCSYAYCSGFCMCVCDTHARREGERRGKRESLASIQSHSNFRLSIHLNIKICKNLSAEWSRCIILDCRKKTTGKKKGNSD